jgi:putative DNA primase/helicase
MYDFGKISSIESLPFPDGRNVKDFDAAQVAARKAARAAKKVTATVTPPQAEAIAAPPIPARKPETAEQSAALEPNASGSLFLVPDKAASGEYIDSVESGKQEERKVAPISRADLSKESSPASTAALIGEIESYLTRYISFGDRSQALTLALWVVGTHVYEVFDAYAYLTITAATKRAGKTRLMELMSFLAARAHHTADITPAALFSLVEDEKPTLLIDEAERFAASQKDFRSIINSGYRRGGTVIRRLGQGVRHFKVYSPKVFVLIGDVYDTLRDRSIIINLRRAHAPQRLIYADAQSEGKELRDELEETAAIHAERMADAYCDLDRIDFLADREEEIWSPLFAICRVLCPDRWDELIRSAVDISTAKTAEAKKYTELPQHENAAEQIEYGERALQDLIQIIRSCRRKSIGTGDAIPALRDLPTAPWRAFRGEGLKPNIEGSMMLASLLEPFGVRPRTIRLRPRSQGATGSTAKGYVLADLIEAAKKTGVFP